MRKNLLKKSALIFYYVARCVQKQISQFNEQTTYVGLANI